MAFSTEWETVYQKNEQLAIWPWSQVVSMVMRFSRLKIEPIRVLEVGCGAGANFPFFLANTPYVFAIDGSKTIIEKLKIKYPIIENNLKVADFCLEIPFEQPFDLIVDRAASTHNDVKSLKNYLSLVPQHLKPNGILIITDWFSTKFCDLKYGQPLENDPYTRENFTSGTFKNLGKVHFFDEPHIKNLTEEFDILHMEHCINTIYSEKNRQTASWNLVLKPKKVMIG